jgi:hypothetical protein
LINIISITILLSPSFHSSLILFDEKKPFLRFQLTSCQRSKSTEIFPPEEDTSGPTSDAAWPCKYLFMSRPFQEAPALPPLSIKQQEQCLHPQHPVEIK